MILPPDIDAEKTQLFLSHLSRAASKAKSKEDSKSRLQEHIEKMKCSSKSKQHRQEIKKLEMHISEVITRENELIRSHKAREAQNARMREKVEALEKKLTAYLESKKKREARIAGIEESVRKKLAAEQREIEILEAQILNIERLYEQISSEKTHTKSELHEVKSKIEALKERLAKKR